MQDAPRKAHSKEAATAVASALGALALAFAITVLLTPLTRVLATRIGALDHPSPDASGHKQHPHPIPYLGGVAIIAGAIVAAAVTRIFVDLRSTAVLGDFSDGILIALGLAAIGLIDDLRPLPRTLRLAAQIGAAVLASNAGFTVSATEWHAANVAITVFWIVGITNAFNLLDNMDGLSTGLAGVSALSFAAMAVLGDLGVLTIVAGAVCGAAFGFLVHNRYPARVYMGDAGSLFLGFMLALIGIELRFENLIQVTFLIPVVALGLPIFDTTIVVLSRLRHRRPVFLGARDHVSHRLVKMGLPVRFAVGLLYGAALCLGWLGLVISRADVEVGWMLLGFVIALGLFFAVLLSRVPVYEGEPEVIPQTHGEAEVLDDEPAPYSLAGDASTDPWR